MKIREATLEDVKRIVAMWSKLMRYHKSFSSYFKLAANGKIEFEKYLRKEMRNKKKAKVLVAQENNKLVGYLLAKVEKEPSFLKIKKKGMITQVFVETKYRKRGIAKALVKKAFKWFKTKGLTYAELTVQVKNRLGKAAWQKMRFKPYMTVMRKKMR